MSINEKIVHIDNLIALGGDRVKDYTVSTVQHHLTLVLCGSKYARPSLLDDLIWRLEKDCYGF